MIRVDELYFCGGKVMSLTRYPNMHFNTIVIGAGPSGLASAYCLQKYQIEYTILEASGRVVNSWYAVWSDFKLGQAVKDVKMPGLNLDNFDPDYHLKRDEIITVFNNYYEQHHLKIKFNIEVTSIQKDHNNIYHIKMLDGEYTAENIILSVGARQQPKFPVAVDKIPEEIRKEKIIHSAWYQGYKSYAACSTILIVGSGLSAISIAQDLLCQTDVNYKVTIACDYTDSEIKQNNQHLNSIGTLEELQKAGVEKLGGLADVEEEKYDLFFNGKKEGMSIHSYEKIIFATGYKVSYALLDKLLNGKVPSHNNGITNEAGLYMVGIPTPGEKTVTITHGGKEAVNVVKHISQQTCSMRFQLTAEVKTEDPQSNVSTKIARYNVNSKNMKLLGRIGLFHHRSNHYFEKRIRDIAARHVRKFIR